MISKGLITKLTKAMYACGIVFLLTGMLLSAVNFPVLAQEGQPEATPEAPANGEMPEDASTVSTKLVLSHIACTDDNKVEIHFILNNVTSGHTPQGLTYTVNGVQRTISGPTKISGGSYHYSDYLEPGYYNVTGGQVTIKYLKTGPGGGWRTYTVSLQNPGQYAGEYCAPVTTPNLGLAANCPDYDNGLNVWTLTNSGDGDTSYSCVGCSDSGSGYLAAGASETVYGLRTDGTETITVSYGEGQTASGDNSGMTDAEAQAAQCYVPSPALAVEVSVKSADCSYATFTVSVTNVGDAPAEGVTLEYGVEGSASGAPTGTTVGALAIGETKTYDVVVDLDWTSELLSDYAKLIATGKINGVVGDTANDSTTNPGTCLDSTLGVVVITVAEGCESATFEVTVTNTGEGTAHDVVLTYTASGDNVAGAAVPASDNVGDLAPGASAGPYTVTVPVAWGNSNNFDLSITLKAKVTDDVYGQATATNQEECYIPDPVVTLEAMDVQECGIYAAEVCVDFSLNISNLPEGSVVTVGGAEYTADGEYTVAICGDWPGIGLGFEEVEIKLYAEALLDGEWMDDAEAYVSYDPESNECVLPEDGLVVQDPFCYVDGGSYKAAWQVVNESEFAISFGWALNGGSMNAATVEAGGMVWLGNFDLDTANTVEVYWGDRSDVLTAKVSSEVCQAPTPEPPDTPAGPPIPVTAVEAPAAVVEGGVLIPVTGVDLGSVSGLGWLKDLMMYLGLGMLGMAFIVHSLNKK